MAIVSVKIIIDNHYVNFNWTLKELCIVRSIAK